VNETKPDLSRLAELAGNLGLHEHLCLLYDTKEEQFAAALPFLRAGLERSERCLYIADENRSAAVLEALRKGGTDVDHSLRSGALIIADKRETYLKHGRFDPDLWIDFLSRATEKEGGGKFSGMRTLLGEMTWALGEDTAPDSLIEYEAKLSYYVRDHDVRILCQYNHNRFPPQLILDIIRTHPVVIYGGIICQNPYYVPPDELLKPNQESREVDRLLNNILKWENSLAQLRALTARLQTVREDERTRVAREIHDELGQALTAIKLEFTALLPDLPVVDVESSQRSQSILKLLDEAIQSIRRIATELRPGILDDIGLVAAVEWAAEEFQTRTGIKCQLERPDADIAMDTESATALFRIVQETLTNVARHANASEVNIRLTEEHGQLTLEVHDNGRGIGEGQLAGNRSLGILGMRERALLIGGELTISGPPGLGTTVRVRIPHSDSGKAGAGK
jgi:signal transduction histidine kinase